MGQPMTRADSGSTQASDTGARSAWADFFAGEFAEMPLVVILRGVAERQALATARAAWAAGIRLVEVTVETQQGLATLETLARAAPRGVPVGAGTVTTPALLERAVAAGAGFGVAPGLDVDTVQAADQQGLPFLPGVATPTEAGNAFRLGLRAVKAFPASVLGPRWVRALSGPFPQLRMVATGGVTQDTAPDFLSAGALAVGVGQTSATPDTLPTLVEAVAPWAVRSRPGVH
ncbi:bifunctional 4-hydroxy-2-oxoglutarate aldolase/2-dehydro-3-deoxy-phosphogluconate aldolase [Lipingzhangella sp. LS1_29]|uniref:Bifunctional 4-hydroxy-2-oxoglutarate aldolase/2-dehydro-3-deoxy-phosphogluconate aldolase n=1 Tax=Lipingzhangella rawalii TaxID=2055835 RepID=A0ABU2H8J3_9ACTN|nr:bifunctional 4-hydroxy-2-oxoglutarate aldolase/2-dehydro-3-deoxy-phosphogluconate aldolase [Lipingzhangella rawalii]MDS1271627.1 bifunctional 4-hydroxy-2-oxoglutarate aldolase/2-dehydro-3-deoxy-phosphogluconate aldolase [Lipingzhangella rawalii]